MLFKLKKMIPKGVKNILRPIHNLVANKYNTELDYWENTFRNENRKFNNSFYKKIMLAMAQEPDDQFLHDKIVADFG